MFVDIETPKTPLKITNILTAYDKGVVIKGVRQSPKKLTPEVCFDILKSTNYPRCIRDMLTCIAKLPDEEQAQFKEVVLSCFDNREQPEPIFQLGQEIAEKSGYGIEFAKLKKMKEGPYLFSEADAQKCYMCFKSEFTDEDFSAYDKVIFFSHDKIQFGYRVKFPKNMEIPNASEVCFYDEEEALGVNLDGAQSIRFKDGAKVVLKGAVNVPVDMDFSCCDEVDLSYCDLSEQPHLRFKEGATVSLYNAKKLPPNLDFSQCDAVSLCWCDLSSQPNLRFKEGAKVFLCNAKNLPPNLDFSMCSRVDLEECDLSEQPNLCFKDGASVDLSGAKNLPKHLDVSPCAEVDLTECDLQGQPNLRFKDGAVVDLRDAYNLQGKLDFSMCEEVNLERCSLWAVQKLVFKNREQMEKSQAHLPYDWKGKLVFADEQQEPPALGLAMTAKTKGGR